MPQLRDYLVSHFYLILALSYPIAVHVAVLLDVPHVAVFVLMYTATCLFILSVMVAAWWRNPWVWVYGVLAASGFGSLLFGHLEVLFFPPILFNGCLALIFGNSLCDGNLPIVERIMRTQHRTLNTEKIKFARSLTLWWLVFFLTMLVMALYLALYASLAAWSLFANVINYVLVVFLFIGQFAWAMRRLGSKALYDKKSIWHTLRFMLSHNTAPSPKNTQ